MSERTTLTLDTDVAIQLRRLQKQRDVSFKELVNDTLRNGLRNGAAPAKKRKPFRTKAVDLGPPLFSSPEELKALINEMDEEYDRRKLGLS